MARFLLVILLMLSTSSIRAEAGDESYLLHRLVAPSLFTHLRIWDATAHGWRLLKPGEAPGETAPILVVHLWADYCTPCRKEFPLMRDLGNRLVQEYPGQVEMIYISETFSSLEMDRFLLEERERMPRAPQYQDTGEAFAQIVHDSRPSAQLTLPVTLVLDEQRVIRQAIIGPIATSRAALASGIERLVRLAGKLPCRPQMR